MSDYSNIKFEKADDLPNMYLSPRQTKPLGPVAVKETLPFIFDLEEGETIKFTMPEDGFGYRVVEGSSRSSDKFSSARAALTRTFQILSKREGIHFVHRMADNEMYIKRLKSNV